MITWLSLCSIETGAPPIHNKDRAPAVYDGVAQPQCGPPTAMGSGSDQRRMKRGDGGTDAPKEGYPDGWPS